MPLTLNQQIERRIVRQVIRDALAAGYALTVHDGDRETAKNCTDYKTVDQKAFATDIAVLILSRHEKSGPKPIGWVRFVYGEGAGVIADRSKEGGAGIAEILRAADALAEKYA